MWVFVMLLCLLDQDQAAPLPWEPSSLQLLLQQQPSPTPAARQQKTSSSSSSASSESSQSSEARDPQLLREGRQNLENPEYLENTAVEQLDSSQERAWLSELVLLGDQAGRRDRGGDTGDDSEESREGRQRPLLFTFQRLLSRPRRPELTAAAEEGGVTTGEGGVTTEEGVVGADVGVVRGAGPDAEFPRLMDGSLTLDSPGHAHIHNHHGNEEGVELGL